MIARRDGHDVPAVLLRRGRFGRRRIADDDMAVRAAETEIADAGITRAAGRGPRAFLAQDFERAVEFARLVGGLEVDLRRQTLVLERKQDLDQPGNAGRGFEMADIRLHRTERQRGAIAAADAEDTCERLDLGRIADRRSRCRALR